MQLFTAAQELKLYLLANGVRVEPEAGRGWARRFKGPLSLVEYASTSGVVLSIDGDFVNAPFVEKFTEATEASLVFDDGKVVVVLGGQRTAVGVIPVPAYHGVTYQEGDVEHRHTEHGVTHTDRCRISPIQNGCAWVCQFCDLPFEKKYRQIPTERLLEVIQL